MRFNFTKTEISVLKKQSKAVFYSVYTVVFLVIFFLGYMSFFLSGKSLIWNCDGFNQHYPALIYIGRYYRRIFLNILRGNFNIPLFDFNIGMGENIIAVLNYYGLGDPLLLLSAFVPSSQSEVLYDALIVLRMYLSGIAFSAFCFYFHKPRLSILIGSIIYVFCGFALILSVRHPFFINPMIYLPLTLIGTDKVIRKKSPVFFVVIIFLSALNGFYFFYMMTAFIFFYALIRFLGLHKKNRSKEFLKVFFKAVALYLLGTMMAGFIFLPAIYGFLDSSRSGGHISAKSLILYPFDHYRNFILGFISGPATWDYLTLAALAVPSVIVLFLKHDKGLKPLKIGFVSALLFAIIPFGGYIMNGFGYVSNRWIFELSFIASFIVVCMMSYLFEMNFIEQIVCLFSVFLYGFLGLLSTKSRSEYTMLAFGMLAFTVAVLLFFQKGKISVCSTRIPVNLVFAAAIISLIVINLTANAVFLFAPDKNNYISEFMDKNTSLSRIQGTPADNVKRLSDTSFYRTDSKSMATANASMLDHFNGVSIYFSIINRNITDFRRELEVSPSMSTAFNLGNLDSRAVLDTLSSVKYYALGNDNADYVPYGFEKTNTDGIYKNKYALPLGYTYSGYITADEFSGMNSLEKQETMLQSAILERDLSGFKKDNIINPVKKINRTVTFDGVNWKNGELTVTKPHAKVSVTFNGLSGCETYIRLNGLDLKKSGIDYMKVGVSGGNMKKTLYVRSPFDSFYYGDNNYLINLGYSKRSINYASLEFFSAGKYKLNDIEVYSIPMNSYPKFVSRLSADTLKNINVTVNCVSGDIHLKSNKILCLSIPYSKGWTATVDGKPAEIFKANSMFMAIPLKKGYHKIELKYFTPGLMSGILFSALGFTIFAVVFIKNNKRFHKR